MASRYECCECEHVQVVGVNENGLSGYADPKETCGGCGRVGTFHFAPGSARQTREMVLGLVAACADGESRKEGGT